MLGAVAVCGPRLRRKAAALGKDPGPWRVIRWAPVLALPLMAPLVWLHPPRWSIGCGERRPGRALPIISLFLFTMLIGFFLPVCSVAREAASRG